MMNQFQKERRMRKPFQKKMLQHEINKTVVIVGVVVIVAMFFKASRQRCLFHNSSKRNTTTARTKSQVCSARKPMTLPAALKVELTIAPIRPGRAEAASAPIVLRQFPKSFPSFFKALVIVPRTAPIVAPAARKMAVTVTPYFLKILWMLSWRGLAASISDI